LFDVPRGHACLVCVELSPTRLSRAVLSAYSLSSSDAIYIADGTARRPAGGARAKMPARAPHDHVTKNLAQTATTHQGRVRLTRLGLPPRRPPGPLSQHAPSRLGQSGHAAPRLTQLESPSHPAASAGPLTGPLHPFHVTRPNAGMCRVSRITCVGTSTVAAFQDSGTCDA